MSKEQAQRAPPATGAAGELDAVELGQIVVRAATTIHDLELLTRPLLEALAKVSGFESTYLTIFDWDHREQEVRFVHSAGKLQVREGIRLPLPEALSRETLPGVTRSPAQLATRTHPDSWVAQRLGLEAYVSVPVVVAKHQLFGMLCGASQAPRTVSESVVSVMEFFAQIVRPRRGVRQGCSRCQCGFCQWIWEGHRGGRGQLRRRGCVPAHSGPCPRFLDLARE